MKTLVVVGVGALGSHLVPLLRSLKGCQVKVIDFDRIEQKNTMSQFHAKSHVGKPKTLGLQQVMKLLWGVRLDVVPHKLEGNNAEQLLGGADLVIDCLDNGAGRRVVQAFVREHDIPCVHGALAEDGAFGRVCWDHKFVIDDEPDKGAATCEDGEHLPFISVTSSLLARAVQLFIEEGQKSGYEITPGAIFVA